MVAETWSTEFSRVARATEFNGETARFFVSYGDMVNQIFDILLGIFNFCVLSINAILLVLLVYLGLKLRLRLLSNVL